MEAVCSSRRERLPCLSGQSYKGLELANCPEWGAEEKEDEHSEKGTKREPSPQPLEPQLFNGTYCFLREIIQISQQLLKVMSVLVKGKVGAGEMAHWERGA